MIYSNSVGFLRTSWILTFAFLFTVTSNAHIVVTNPNDSGTSSFRRAIDQLNSSAGVSTINFDIPGLVFTNTADGSTEHFALDFISDSNTIQDNLIGLDLVENAEENGYGTFASSGRTIIDINYTPPVANDDSYDMKPGTELIVDVKSGLLANDSDSDGDQIYIQSYGLPENGTFTEFNLDGSFIYVPEKGFIGTESILYIITDGNSTAAATLTITVNNPPIANDDDYTVISKDNLRIGALNGLLANDSDPDGQELRVISDLDAQNGDLTVDYDGSFVYYPYEFAGVEEFTYTISDGISTATAKLTIEVVNNPPVANDDEYTMTSKGELRIGSGEGLLANDSDPDGHELTVISDTEANYGDFWVERDGSFEYYPYADFAGIEELSYTITDGMETTSAKVIIEVVNNPPVANDDYYTIVSDGDLNTGAQSGVLANDSDPDGHQLTVTSVTEAENGRIDIEYDGSIDYVPYEDFEGTEEFTYTITDGIETATAKLTINVTNNQPPIAVDDIYTTPPNTILRVDAASGVLANDSDPDGQTLEVIDFTSPVVGTLNISPDGSLTYTPPEGFIGQVYASYSVSDGIESVGGLVFFDIDPEAYAPPIAVDDIYTTPPNTILTVDVASGVLTNDTNFGDKNLEVIDFTNSKLVGTLNMSTDGSFTYTPQGDYVGVEELTYTISDGVSTATAKLIIKVNTPPFAEDDTYTMPPSTTLTVDAASGVLANDTDPDGQTLEVIDFISPGVGTLNISPDGSFTYTPPEGFEGQVYTSYTVSDGIESVGGLVFFDIDSEASAPPIVVDDMYRTPPNTILTVDVASGVLANDSDPDGNDLEVISYEEAENGDLNIASNGAFTYQPYDGFLGDELIAYRASDGEFSTEGVMTISVEDTPPVTASSCEAYDPQPLSRGFGGNWTAAENEQSASFYVPASQRGGGIIKATLSAGHASITPRLIVCIDGECSGGSIVGHTAIDETSATVEFQAAAGQSYNFNILQFGNAPEEDYPVSYSLNVEYEDKLDCWEGNDTVDQAKQIAIGETLNAYLIEGFENNYLQNGEYADWYTFELEQEAFIEVNVPKPAGMHLMRLTLLDEPDENVADVLLEGQQEEKGQPFIAKSTRARTPGRYYLKVGTLLSDDATVIGVGDPPDHWGQEYEMIVSFLTTPAATVLSTPANEASGVSINPILSWQAVADANTYELEVSDALDFSTIVVSETDLTATEFNVTSLEYQKTYYWRVRAFNEAGYGDWSAVWSFSTENTPDLFTPINLTISKNDNKIDLAWEINDGSFIDGFRIYRGTSADQLSEIASVSSGIFTYTDSDQIFGTVFYAVKAFSEEGMESDFSNVMSYYIQSITAGNTWQMISLPVKDVEIGTAQSLVYGFDGTYIKESLMIEGRGYWIKSDNGEQINAEGEGLTQADILLSEGWNMVGSLVGNVPVNTIEDFSSILTSAPIFHYETSTYVEASELQPNKGYWVFAESEGTISLKVHSEPSVQQKTVLAQADQSSDISTDKIIFSQNGTEAFLEVSNEPVSREVKYRYLRPPLAPDPILDVRTADGYGLSDKNIFRIKLTAASYPVAIRLESIVVPDYVYRIKLVDKNGQKDELNLVPGKSVILNREYETLSLEKLMADEAAIEMALEPSYPNPFNPSTNVQYALSTTADVSIDVFNITGRKVATLVNQQQAAGIYTITFNASRLASGIYFLRFQAGSFSEIQKLTLIK